MTGSGEAGRCEVVATGSWLYGGVTRKPVYILLAEYDFWYEIGKADDQLEPGEEPVLNEEGVAYYLTFEDPPLRGGRFWAHGSGFMSVEDAKAGARRLVPSEIEWLPAP